MFQSRGNVWGYLNRLYWACKTRLCGDYISARLPRFLSDKNKVFVFVCWYSSRYKLSWYSLTSASKFKHTCKFLKQRLPICLRSKEIANVKKKKRKSTLRWLKKLKRRKCKKMYNETQVQPCVLWETCSCAFHEHANSKVQKPPHNCVLCCRQS